MERIKQNEDHTTEFANMLFVDSQKDVAIAIADGPYIHIEINRP